MPAATCPKDDDLKAYAWGESRLQNEAELADHLETCPRCESVVQTLERRGDSLLARLRMPVKPDPYQDEIGCRQVVQRLLNRATSNDEQVAKPSLPPLTCPGRFRDYELLEKLGEGGMGTVYKARHQQLKKHVAIKILLPGPAQDPQRIARFKREMKAVGQLDHPNIVRAMDAGQAEGRHYMVMEHVEGLDLSKIVDRIGPLAVADACEIVRQVAIGLRAADEQALIHRDIKPSNLMLTPDGRVKILDLGLAVFETDHTPEGETTAYGQIMGTPDYIAPEQINDAHSVDARADIYSLGCTLYKLLTGRAPFDGPRYKSAAEKMTAHLRDPVPPIRTLLPQVPAKLVAVLDRMLVKDRDLRIPTPGRLVDELAMFCVGSDLAGLVGRALHGLPSALEKARHEVDATATFPQKSLRPTAGAVQGAGEDVSPRPPLGEGQGARAASGNSQSPQGTSGAQPVVAAVNMNQGVKRADFDPYHKWLGIPPDEQPPTHYRLLGLQAFESDPEVILAAVMRQSAHLKTYQLGKHAALTQKLLNEVSAAKVCLLDPQRKAAYDARLRKEVRLREKEPRPQPILPTAEPLPAPPPVAAVRTPTTSPVSAASSAPAEIPEAIPADSAEPVVDPSLANMFAEFQQNAQPSSAKAKKRLPVRKQSAKSLSKRSFKWPPRLPRNRWLAAAGGAALLLLGVYAAVTIVRVRDKEGNVIAEIKVPEGGTAEVSKESKTKTEGRPNSPRPLAGETRGVRGTVAPPLAVAPFDAKKAKEHQAAWAKHLGVPVEITNSVGMKFAWIPAGSFLMGSPAGEEGRANNELLHRVTLTKGFYLGIHAVTRGQFAEFVKATAYRTQAEREGSGRFWTGSNWKVDPNANWRTPEFEQSDDHPVVCISWNDAVAFGDWLSAKELEGRRYRLPTEAEWEYACRAGTATAFFNGNGWDTLKNVGWCSYDGRWNSAGRTKPVGQFQANGWGLYDMHGNAWEWCQDWFGDYPAADQTDPKGPTQGICRVLRGGCWGLEPRCCRSAYRIGHEMGARDHHLGFRLALTLPDEPHGGTAEKALGTVNAPNLKSEISDSKSQIPPLAVAPFDEKKAKEHQEAWAKHLSVPAEITNSIGTEFG